MSSEPVLVYKRGEGWVYSTVETIFVKDRSGKLVRMERRDPEPDERGFYIDAEAVSVKAELANHLSTYTITQCPTGVELQRDKNHGFYPKMILWTGCYE